MLVPIDVSTPGDAAPCRCDGNEPPADLPAGEETLPRHLPTSCQDPPWSVYETPAGLSPFEPAQRGAVVRCGKDLDLPRFYLELALAENGHAMEVLPDSVSTWLVAFRTERTDGVGGTSTARVYMPENHRREGEFLVVAHGTVGLADQCAPSRSLEWSNYLVMPLVARGWPVIAPDYAGLGNEGTHGYGNTQDTAHSVLDAARAMGQLYPELQSAPFAVVGHSQGGGAAMAAQALAGEYGPEENFAGAAALAPGYGFVDRSTWVYLPDFPLAGAAYAYAMIYYADFANLLGEEDAGFAFAPDIREYVVAAIANLCAYDYVDYMETLADTIGQLLDDDFEEGVRRCLEEKVCPSPMAEYTARSKASACSLAPEGAPLLIAAGEFDLLVPPETLSCMEEWLGGDDVEYQLCGYDGADHMTLIPMTYPFLLDWLEALLGGQTPPQCPAYEMPACPWTW